MLTMRRSRSVVSFIFALLVIYFLPTHNAQAQTTLAPSTMTLQSGNAAATTAVPCHNHCCSYGYKHGFYTTDGRNIYWFPYGYPRSIQLIRKNADSGPDLRFATRYRWSHRHYHACACRPVYQLQFQGPYWTHTTYRPARGLFRRSSWRCIRVPYYVAPIPNASVLGSVPHALNSAP